MVRTSLSRVVAGAVSAFTVAGLLVAGAGVASAGEVARSHPIKDTDHSVVDNKMTLVKYYQSGAYAACVVNYHHTGEVSNFTAKVYWSDGYVSILALPKGGDPAGSCSTYRYYHLAEYVYYDLADGRYGGSV